MEKLCVVKTALPHLLGKGYGQRFRDEASVVVRLSHGNLVTVFDAGQVAGEIFIAMDFVDGKDLRAVWNRCAQQGRRLPDRHRGPHRQGDGPRPGLRARLQGAAAGPPGHLAAQRAALVHGRGEDHRLRPGLVDPEAGEDRPRDHLRQGQLHGARAGAGRGPGRPRRHLRRRHHPVGAADRAAAVPGAAGQRHRRRGAGARCASPRCSRPRSGPRACPRSWTPSS